MQIFVKSVDGVVLTLTVELTDTIEKIKLELQDKTCVPIKDQMLVCNGKHLYTGSLQDNNVVKDSYMHLSGRLCAD